MASLKRLGIFLHSTSKNQFLNVTKVASVAIKLMSPESCERFKISKTNFHVLNV